MTACACSISRSASNWTWPPPEWVAILGLVGVLFVVVGWIALQLARTAKARDELAERQWAERHAELDERAVDPDRYREYGVDFERDV